MNRSFIRLVVTSVLGFWAVGLVGLVVYSKSLSWTEHRAQGDGVFLAHSLLEQEPIGARAQRLRELQDNFSVDLMLMTMEQVTDKLGRTPNAGEQIPLRVSSREEWYFLVFYDGSGALAAGPVRPGIPNGLLPVGIIAAVVLLPMLAGFMAIRVQRELSKVEQASDALATGRLDARVDNPKGPGNELAASFNAMAARV